MSIFNRMSLPEAYERFLAERDGDRRHEPEGEDAA